MKKLAKLLFSGRIKYLTAAVFGAVSSFAFAPYNQAWLLIPAFIVFLTALDQAENKKQSFLIGWFFGLGQFTFGLYWISYALLVDAEDFAWLIPFAILLIPSVLALYIGLLGLIYHKVNLRGILGLIFFSLLWVTLEIARSYLFTGFPWNLLGYSFAASDIMVQTASVFGVFGLSLLACLGATAGKIYFEPEHRKAGTIYVSVIIALLAANYGYGYFRLKNITETEGKKLNVILVQANIPQKLKWDVNERIAGVYKHLAITKAAIAKSEEKNNTLIVWSETSVPMFLQDELELLKTIGDVLPKGFTLLTGSLRYEGDENNPKLFNTSYIIDSDGLIQTHYDKSHLVPFGEYVPFRKILFFVEKITKGMVDFTAGSGIKSLEVGDIKLSPLICYEAIFPSQVLDKKSLPDLLVNTTNDAWYGVSPGPFQHYQMVKLRAIEEGLPMLRVANTGISGIFDSYGREIAKLELNHTGFTAKKLNIIKLPTHYGTFGNWLLISLLALGFGTIRLLSKKVKI